MSAGRSVFTSFMCPASVANTSTNSTTVAAEAAAREQRRLAHHTTSRRRMCGSETGDERTECLACADRNGYSWLLVQPDARQAIERLAVTAQTTVGRLRCQRADLLPYHRIIAETRREVEQMRTGVRDLSTQVASLRETAGGSGGSSSADMTRLAIVLLGTQAREQLTRELDRAHAELRLCQDGRSLAPRIDPRDVGREVAPPSMALWPAEAVRAQGFRPRAIVQAQTEATRCEQEQLRYANAREQVNGLERNPLFPDAMRARELVPYLQHMLTYCPRAGQEGDVNACATARSNLSNVFARMGLPTLPGTGSTRDGGVTEVPSLPRDVAGR